MENPFETIAKRLSTIEELLIDIKHGPRLTISSTNEVGGIDLATKITRLSKDRIYALVSQRAIPHSKRGNRLHFNRAELQEWIANGKRAEQTQLSA